MNNKDETFIECSKKAGLDHNGSISPTFADYDNDGFIDIYISTNQGANRLYHNEGDGTFSEVGQKAGVNFSRDNLAIWHNNQVVKCVCGPETHNY
ncbi:VCBS repeat-containing protein [Candidatus Poribacteria bacterium]|nr:VCBS repeat-containing protein [Candidatus Poribacteria bacterium]